MRCKAGTKGMDGKEDRTEQLCADLEPEDRGTVGVKACETGGLGGSGNK